MLSTSTRGAIGSALLAALLLATTPACDNGGLHGAKAEVQKTNIALDLPKVPAFVMPKPYPDGTHSAREMRLQGKKYLGQQVQVKGYVVWKYNCASAIRKPGMTDKQVKKILSNHPEKCERPNMYLADAADLPPEKGIWVVEVPRPPRPDERRNLPRATLKAWPKVPKYAVGDHVIVTGKWALQSPHGATKSEGLLVYKGLQHLDASGNPIADNAAGNAGKGGKKLPPNKLVKRRHHRRHHHRR